MRNLSDTTSGTSQVLHHYVHMYFKRNLINGWKLQPDQRNKTAGNPEFDEYQMLVFPGLRVMLQT